MSRVTLPTGRAVQGDFHTLNDKKDPTTGKIKLNDKGEPIKELFFAVAIPKGAEPRTVQLQTGSGIKEFPGWIQTDWGKPIWEVGWSKQPTPEGPFQKGAWFAWKIIDGDSTELIGTPPKRICDYEGFAGHWVVRLTSGFLIRTYNTSYEPLPDGAIKRGYYVQVAVDVKHNENQAKPGVYLNPSLVMLIAYGKEIMGASVDPRSVGFNPNAALPAGASATPVGQMPSGQGTLPGIPAGVPLPLPGAGAPSMTATAVAPMTVPGVAAVPAVVHVTPNPAILPQVSVPGAGPAVPAIPGVPGGNPVLIPPPPVAGPQLTEKGKATGATYAQLIAGGWNDVLLRQHGYIV